MKVISHESTVTLTADAYDELRARLATLETALAGALNLAEAAPATSWDDKAWSSLRAEIEGYRRILAATQERGPTDE